MTRRPLVSIVTPTLNQARFIGATIESIRAQSYGHYEHIVVDGGSTDGTADILRALEGRYPVRWISEPDRGLYDAVNKGMRLAKGDILCYLNSDDLYFPWTLEEVVEAFSRWPDADFIHGDVLNVDDETARQTPYLETPYDRDFLQTSGSMSQPGMFWRSSAFETTGPFDAELRFVGDLEFFIRAGKSCRFRKVNELLAIERNHRGTLREGHQAAMAIEVAGVRARYARPTSHGRAAVGMKAAVWRRFWFRALWAAFVTQATLPASLRLRWWRRYLAEGRTRVVRRRIMAMLFLPVAGRRMRDRLVEPGRHWLRTPAPEARSPRDGSP
jgi:glycosyltransferase involved in cell wall biosynthesis